MPKVKPAVMMPNDEYGDEEYDTFDAEPMAEIGTVDLEAFNQVRRTAGSIISSKRSLQGLR